MAYESVLWTPKTPITSDRLAQMQENIDELRSMLEGSQSYVPGTPVGAGKGIMHLQEIVGNINVPNNAFVNVGEPFTPVTESGRRYLFEVHFPRVHSYSGSIAFEMLKGSELIHSFVVGPNSNAESAFLNNFAAGFFADSAYAGIHLVPGASTTAAYSVRALAYLNYTSGQIAGSSTVKSFIKFSDVGPALG